MSKIDLFKTHRDEYSQSREPHVVKIGAGRYLTVSGSGGPGGAEFKKELAALYGCAYTIKFDGKRRDPDRDFKVGVLEGLWWAPGRGADGLLAPKKEWRWKLLIRVPTFVTAAAVRSALKALRAKGRPAAAVALETMSEGTVVQALHVGAYADEPKTLAKMREFARDAKLRFRGKHHEIYLSDPRRVPTSRLRTILRHPVRAV